MDNKFKVSLYIRVSTGRQAKEGDSLEEQESELKKFCEYKKYPIHKIHIERGRSAKNTNRPEYQKLLADIKDQKINAVVVKKLDRLSRSLLDFEEFMRIAQKHDVEFISIKENFDTTNAMGKAMLRVALVFAQLEREQTAERIKDVFAFRTEQGLRNGATVPYGYDSINKELIPHKKERKDIELIFNKFIETKSTTITTKELNASGSRKRTGELWDKRRVDYMLRNLIYTGKISWTGIIYPGIHQPLVSETVFQRVQDIFASRKYHRENNKVNGILKGFLYCGFCDCQMTPNYAKKKNNKLYFYYRCVSTLNPMPGHVCQNKYLKMANADEKVFEKILEYSTENKLKLITLEIEKKNAKALQLIKTLELELAGLNNNLKTICQKKETYLDSLVANKFSEKERNTINGKIEEFSVKEKNIQGNIYKKEAELSSLKNEVISIDEFKKEMIFFKINHQSMSQKELQSWFSRNITKIVYKDEKNINITLKLLDILV